MTRLVTAANFDDFRRGARSLITEGISPDDVLWEDAATGQRALSFGGAAERHAASDLPATELRISARFVELARRAVHHRSADRFDFLYRFLYQLVRTGPALLHDDLDPRTRELHARAHQVQQDEHRMHAFLRFRRVPHDGALSFVAWYEPEHLVLPLTAPFFVRRLGAQQWAILTPDQTATWDGDALSFGPGLTRRCAPRADDFEALFLEYYRATYNPARANRRLFQHHVPRRFQSGMPELKDVSLLLREPSPDAHEDAALETAEPLLPASRELPVLRSAAAGCGACDLGQRATRTVFGEGPSQSGLVLIGEQPGDEEDRAGRPFVGPAGTLLDRALADAGIDRSTVYLTNAVKHFGFEERGKRRLHAKPKWRHVAACRPWLRAELEAVAPSVIVCLGATAAQSFLGPRFSVNKNRGRVFETAWARAFLVTYHPAAILRAPNAEVRDKLYAALVSDLRSAAQQRAEAQ